MPAYETSARAYACEYSSWLVTRHSSHQCLPASSNASRRGFPMSTAAFSDNASTGPGSGHLTSLLRLPKLANWARRPEKSSRMRRPSLVRERSRVCRRRLPHPSSTPLPKADAQRHSHMLLSLLESIRRTRTRPRPPYPCSVSVARSSQGERREPESATLEPSSSSSGIRVLTTR